MSRKKGPERRAELLETALGLFSSHGFEGTSTRAIAEAAGVTEALIFHYFPTKLALFHAVIVEYGFQSVAAIPPDVQKGIPLPEMLTVLFTGLLSAMWKNRVAFRMLIGSALNDPVANDDLTMLDVQARERLDLLFAPYVASGEIKAAMADPVAAIIVFTLQGFFFATLRSEPEDWEAVLESFIQNLISVITLSLQP